MLNWAKSIACYVIAVSLLMGILPEGNYKKYVKFFTGIVLSLLLLSPVMKLFSFDTILAHNYRKSIAKVWEEAQEEREQENVEVVLKQTLDCVGYTLMDVAYEKTQKGDLIGLTVWIEEENDEFEVPVVLIEQIAVKIDTKQKEQEKQMETEETIALKTIISSMCAVEEEQIKIIRK